VCYWPSCWEKVGEALEVKFEVRIDGIEGGLNLIGVIRFQEGLIFKNSGFLIIIEGRRFQQEGLG